MPIAAIAFDFDPLVRLGSDLSVRWQTLALAVVVLICLAAAGILARRRGLRADDLLYVVIGAAPGAVIGGRIGYALLVPEAFSAGPLSLLDPSVVVLFCLAAAGILARRRGLRADDLLYVVIGAAPGAVIGGRIGYALLVPEAFSAGPLSLFDPSVGGLELGTAVVGGIATAAIVATLLGSPVGAWAHIASIPLLTAIGAGKLTMVLGGSGQGRPFDGDWATAFVGPGPWVAAAAGVPSHPSQVYEAVGTVLVALLILAAGSLGVFRSADGSRLLVALAGWSVARAVASLTWRDPSVIGALPAGGLIALLISVASLIGVVVVAAWWPRRQQARAAAAEPRWPEPEVRPPF